MELAFYNTVLAGMQADGKRFFYVNPLEIIPGISGVSPTHRHDLTQRPKWYTCACCPPNVARLISSFGQYAYGSNETTAFCHLFAAGRIEFGNGMKLTCETEYPYDFTVTYKIEKGGKLAVRIPSWSNEYTIEVNGEKLAAETEKGYVYVAVSDGDTVKLTLDGTPRFVYGSAKVPELSGKTAICRGPLVYCFEGIDKGDNVVALSLKRAGKISVEAFNDELLSGTVTLFAEGTRREDTDALYSSCAPAEKDCTLVAVPYYTWGNRGENQMRVWMNEVR